MFCFSSSSAFAAVTMMSMAAESLSSPGGGFKTGKYSREARGVEQGKRLYRYRNVWEGVIIIHRRDPNRSWSRGHPKYGQDGE